MKQVLMFILIFQLGQVIAQTSDPELRKVGFLTSNNIALSAYNDGAISGFDLNTDIRGEWPIGSGEYYIGDMTPCIGLELPIKDYDGDGILDTIHSVIISRGPRNMQDAEVNPTTGHFRGFNPVTNYVNENSESFPISDNQDTWPLDWNSIWPGLYNTGEIIAEKEALIKMDDFWDDEFNNNFYPIASDTNITGHGIEVTVRYLQFNSLGLEDVLYRVYDITNNSDHNYDNVLFGNITGTLMGGDGDSGDDMAIIDTTTQIMYSYDTDGIGNIGQRTATMAEAIIENPTERNLCEFKFFGFFASPNMSNDVLLWSQFTEPSVYSGGDLFPMDGDMLYSTKKFSLNSKETKRVVSVIAFDYSKSFVQEKILRAEALWYNLFDLDQNDNNLKLNEFNGDSTYSNYIPINWESTINGGTVELYYSGDFGETWTLIGDEFPNNGSYNWNSSEYEIEESPFGQIKSLLKDASGYIIGYSLSNYFLIDNPPNGKPILSILNEKDLYNEKLTEENIELSLLMGDSEKEILTLKIYYKTSKYGSYELLDILEYSFSNVAYLYNLKLLEIPNSDEITIKFELNDSENEFVYETWEISKFNEREVKPNEYLTVLSGYAESSFDIHVVDEISLLPEKYLITFDDTSSSENVYYNIEKYSDGSTLYEHELLLPNIESKVFNGIAFETDFIKTKYDTARSNWNSDVSSRFDIDVQPIVFSRNSLEYGYGLPNDYKIIFYENIVDTSLADTLGKYPPRIFPAKPINFKIWNTTKNSEVDCSSFSSGTLSSVLSIWFHEENRANRKRTWKVNIFSEELDNYPVGGDTLSLFTKKGYSIYDSLIIEKLIVSVKENKNIVREYSLEQNYPNPFNPSSTINYSIPKQSVVTIKVFDVLGREVATLVNKEQPQGNYKIEFDASNLTSGIYFYRIHARDFVNTKKMILLR